MRSLPNHKHYFDFLIAILSIPALITALILNINSLQKNNQSNKTQVPTPTATVAKTTETVPPVRSVTRVLSPIPNSSSQCTPGIGNLNISSPTEGQTTTNNPTCIQIDYIAGNNCGVVWKYRVNGGDWSDYGNNAACFYNLPSGQNLFELQAKSLVSDATLSLQRNFMYNPQVTMTPTATPSFTPTPMSSTSAK